ncbi:MAG: hypothetical protein M0Q23_01555 [Syntrophales bacterium]|jgi:transposase-like protein|nr:hypothetical protein [Syntrophales bacterium]MCK9527334.1 hypothetical protein [Syntrophales bacterium]MDX9921196.1 hypothetical protein [Syntrophales bacterium]
MAQACRVCNHDKRIELDRKILQGKSIASISREYGVSEDALYRHRDNHITRQLATAMAQKELHRSMDLLGEIDELLRRTKRIMNKAEEKDNPRLELKAIAEARGSYELLSKIALTLHQIKIMELEQEQKQIEQDNTSDLSMLNDRELAMFERLVSKIHKADPSIEVLRERKAVPFISPGVTDPAIDSEEPSPVDEDEPSNLLRVQPLKARLIPG